MEQETIKMEETRKQRSRLEVIGAVITVEALVLKAWENHGKTMEKAWGKFHGFP